MDKQAAIRRVRIAVSVFFGVLTILLCVLWVRSYTCADLFWCGYGPARNFDAGYWDGHIGFSIRLQPASGPFAYGVSNVAMTNELREQLERNLTDNSVSGFRLHIGRAETIAYVPIWCVLLVIAIATVAMWRDWLPLCFSLRTMLLATTLVAIVLGLGVWLMR